MTIEFRFPKHNELCAIGLIPYVGLIISHKSVFALSIFINGLVFHLFFPKEIQFKAYDICCNLAFCLYVNYVMSDIFSALLTVVAIISFILNFYRKNHCDFIGSLIHISFVQWIGLSILYKFEIESKSKRNVLHLNS
jgi:hypothetical protein